MFGRDTVKGPLSRTYAQGTYKGYCSTISRAERAKRTAKKKEAKRQRMIQRRKIMEGIWIGIVIGVFVSVISLLTIASFAEDAGKKQCGFMHSIEKCENRKLVYYPNGYHLEVVKD